MMAWIWQLFAGCVKIRLEGLKLIALLNEAAEAGLVLQRARRLTYSRMEAEVSWRDYRKLLALARSKPLRVTVLYEWGLPHVAGLARRRIAFVLGLLLCIGALVAVNQFVLQVRVEGCPDPKLAGQIETYVAEQGITPGAGKWTLNLRRTETLLMLRFPELSFATVRVQGIRATVQVAMGDPEPVLIDKDKPCDIVAGRDAVVRTVTVMNGRAVVAPGDPVRAGQVLVSGVVEWAEGQRQVHARADVEASVWYEGRGSAPLYTEHNVRTGRASTRWVFSIGNYVLAIKGAKPPFGRYDTEVREYYLLGWMHKGPKVVVTEYLDAFRIEQERDLTVARAEALQQAAAELSDALPNDANVVERRVEYTAADGTITVHIYMETLMNIAVEAPLR